MVTFENRGVDFHVIRVNGHLPPAIHENVTPQLALDRAVRSAKQ